MRFTQSDNLWFGRLGRQSQGKDGMLMSDSL
jgi:hypothetical protein